MPPKNFGTAIKAAAYLTAITAYPDSQVTLSDRGRVLQIDDHTDNLDFFVEASDPNKYKVQIGRETLYLSVNDNFSFGISGDYGGKGAQREINCALNKTGFTPTTKFRWGNARNLKAYGHLFDQIEYHRHLDQLVASFPNQTKEEMGYAKQADVTRVSQTYLDIKLANESCIEIPLYGATRIPTSNVKRVGILALGTAVAIGASILTYSLMPGEAQQTVQRVIELYKEYLLERGLISTSIVNSATMGLFYGVGDLGGQYIEGNLTNREFDKRRFKRQTALGFAYGVECTGFYKLLKECISLPTRLATSFVQSIADANFFGSLHFNPRHIHMMEKEERLTIGDYFVLGDIRAWSKIIKNVTFRGKAAIAAAYSTLFWLPFQTWNRNYHTPEEAVGYVSFVVPPFTVFLSLISNEKRQLIEFKQVMESLKQAIL